VDKWINEILERSQGLACGLQPWDEYFRLRAAEMDGLFSIYDMKRAGNILEIGCGNGFVSAILSGFADEVVATDLSEFDTKTHSLGISKAEELFKKLDIKNAGAVSCSGQALPFRDKAFDVVFCFYTLEHMKDRGSAMREAGRVLKDGGEAVFVIPGFMERIAYPFVYYSEIAVKASRLLFMNKDEHGAVHDNEGAAGPARTLWRRFKNSYPRFPVPDPHGEYPNYFMELASSLPSAWIGAARKNNLKVKKLFTTMLFPKSVSSVFVGEKSLDLYIKTLRLNKKIGGWPFLKYFGQNLCLVLESRNA
jgi:SAM-dependent methyltransferase